MNRRMPRRLRLTKAVVVSACEKAQQWQQVLALLEEIEEPRSCSFNASTVAFAAVVFVGGVAGGVVVVVLAGVGVLEALHLFAVYVLGSPVTGCGWSCCRPFEPRDC